MKALFLALLLIGLAWPAKSEMLHFIVKVGKPIVYENATFIKVNGVYISSKICKETPSACIDTTPAPPSTIIQPVVVAPVRTAAECAWARQRDFDAWVYSQYPNVSPAGMAEADKNMLLDNMAQGSQSWQARCRRGEVNP